MWSKGAGRLTPEYATLGFELRHGDQAVWLDGMTGTRQGGSWGSNPRVGKVTVSREIVIGGQVGIQERSVSRLQAAFLGLQGNEDGIDLGKHLGIVELEDPAFIVPGVLIEDTQALG